MLARALPLPRSRTHSGTPGPCMCTVSGERLSGNRYRDGNAAPLHLCNMALSLGRELYTEAGTVLAAKSSKAKKNKSISKARVFNQSSRCSWEFKMNTLNTFGLWDPLAKGSEVLGGGEGAAEVWSVGKLDLISIPKTIYDSIIRTFMLKLPEGDLRFDNSC